MWAFLSQFWRPFVGLVGVAAGALIAWGRKKDAEADTARSGAAVAQAQKDAADAKAAVAQADAMAARAGEQAVANRAKADAAAARLGDDELDDALRRQGALREDDEK